MRLSDINELLYGVAARFARCVVTVSEAVAEQHKKRWPGLTVRAIPNWLEERVDLPQDFQPSDGIIRAAVVARLVPTKGVKDVVSACAGMQGIELHVYGDGPMRDQLRKMGRQFTWLHYHGHVDDLLRRLPAYSILISGSYAELEAFSYAVAEGIQAGLLCVLTGIPVHRELLGDGYPEGLFFPPGNPAALQHALQTARALLVNDHGEGARRAVSAAMARIAMRNSPPVARQRYLAVLSAAGVDCGVQ
jgi:glycosyltransferase involved in cell wall biosynthesis